MVENFSFTLFQGESRLGAEKLNMDQVLGKPIVLNFWAGQCPPCRAEMPDLQEFYEGSKDEVTFWASTLASSPVWAPAGTPEIF